MSTGPSLTHSFRHTIVEGRDYLPRVPPPGDYVVIDVLQFSTTVTELLALGAEHVHVTDERGDEFAYRAENPRTLIGGGKTDDFEPTDGYDFFNSPSYVQELPLAGRPTSMTSKNGGRTVARLRRRGGEGVSVFVGGYTNAAALADHLADRDRPTTLVSCGSKGASTLDDYLGAVVLDRYLSGRPPSEDEKRRFANLLEQSRGPAYVERHETRRRDLEEYASAIDSRSVVPKLEDATLVDAACA